MHEQSPSVTSPRRGWRRTRLLAGTLALTVGTLGAGLAVTAAPAFADVTSSPYTIGTPSGGVTSVTASPSSVSSSASTGFSLSFTTPAALAGSSSSWISVMPSVALGTAPTSITLLAGSCIQGGTAGVGGGGISATNSLLIYLQSSCSIAAGTSVTVQFNANAPASGSFFFSVTTSANGSAATSNAITVGAGVSLTAASHNFGTNTTYSITNVPVSGLATSTTAVTLSAVPSGGAGTIAFSTGTAGYTVTYTPSGGSAAIDTVTAVSPGTPGPRSP